jgi:DNA-binding NtrC family response regulator
MREIMAVIARCAPSDAPVLICGEPDTGKETVAREIHRRSRRAAGPFVRVPCGALREPELAQRLFGQAGSGLDRQNQPAATLLEKARGGTLFLENVSQLPLWSQDKLLDLVQGEQCSCDQPTMDVRVIASTGADLPAAVAARSFSSSLYYYLNVVQIQVPPLRSRPQDIGPLAEAILASAVAVRTRGSLRCPCRFSEDALQRMAEHDWPGNISQLAGAVTHAVLLADGEEITWSMLTESLGEVAPRHDGQNISVPLTGGLKEIERAVIEAVIERCRGNKAAAARMLRLHRRTLYRILQDDHHAKKGQVPMPLIVGPTVDACATNAVG